MQLVSAVRSEGITTSKNSQNRTWNSTWWLHFMSTATCNFRARTIRTTDRFRWTCFIEQFYAPSIQAFQVATHFFGFRYPRVSTTTAANNTESSNNRPRTEEEIVENQEPPIGYEDEFVVEVNLRSSIRNVLYAEMDITQLREQRERSLLV
ncbi:hypothetical protein NQZ79_g4674 [Umbelopsis isabellina]|nr:hypothetical protein NQZ79_g4674 [Umbelopsis isabellina]